ncbi:MAG: hypothetical protein COX81_00660 [Candidatus Magasanikbacteria bacterium CG_4_10_14_0_2_um_filter_37_12]|uniref:Uncharacterized protein n=1 Tax=Candidatus Magasanikbacteria bacterium CG_4_10_14_0_2_um_filter_37_12 TaxID=1974637 RepID=A0A2M7V9P7_9BACT|nr:MAG: hypothetical protein COX81_00660 [Candidatus Magasanikbacteria bacterium CG_4_10_14_0_2_um_filter_37_12]
MSVKPKKRNHKKEKDPNQKNDSAVHDKSKKHVTKEKKTTKKKKTNLGGQTKKQIKQAAEDIPGLIAKEMIETQQKTPHTNKKYTTKDLLQDSKNNNKNKNHLMWLSVIAISTFIFIMWGWNLSGLIIDTKNRPVTEGTPINSIKENFQESMEIAKQIENGGNGSNGLQKTLDNIKQEDVVDKAKTKEDLKKLLSSIINTSTEKITSATTTAPEVETMAPQL